MTTFDEREKGFEAKYKRDQEMEFKAQARRNKLLGLWAAGLMDIEGEGAQAYAREVIESDFEEPGDEDVFNKVFGDITAKGVACDEGRLRKKMSELLDVAREQIKTQN